MGYVGNEPDANYTSFAQQTITGNGGTSYTLSHAVASGKEILLYINNVKQEEGSGKAYEATGTTLTLSEAITSSDSCYCVFLGKALQTTVPPDGSVTSAKLATSLDFQNITIKGGSTNAMTISSTGEVEQPQMTVAMFSPSDNDSVGNGTITMGSSSHVAWLSMHNDSDFPFKNIGSPPTFDSNGIFTFPSTGVYEIHHVVGWYSTTDNNYCGTSIEISQDSGGNYEQSWHYTQLENYGATGYASANAFLITNVTNASTFRARFRLDHHASITVRNKNYSRTTFKKIAPAQT